MSNFLTNTDLLTGILDNEGLKKVSRFTESYSDMEKQAKFSYNYYRLVVCFSGLAEYHVVLNGKEEVFSMKPGEAVVIPPGAFFRSINEIPYETCGVLVREKKLDFFTNDETHKHIHRSMVSCPCDGNFLESLFIDNNKSLEKPRLLRAYATLILEHVLEVLKKEEPSGGAYDRFIQARDYVEKHFSFNINGEKTAKVIEINPNYLNSLFHRFAGSSFIAYLLRRRLKEACRLLKETSHSMKEISRLCGFNSSIYFTRQFKKHYGNTPLKFRKS